MKKVVLGGRRDVKTEKSTYIRIQPAPGLSWTGTLVLLTFGTVTKASVGS